MTPTSAVVPVDVPGARYDVTVSPGLLARAGEIVAALSKARRVGVVTDSDVGPRHLPALTESLSRAGLEVVTHTLPAGEEHKTIEQVARAYDTFLPARFDR